MSKEYTADTIRHLKDWEAIQENPAQYIGDTSTPFNLFRELVDNSIDEHVAGHGSMVEVKISKNLQTITVTDTGRGLPYESRMVDGVSISTAIATFTRMNMGGKFRSGDTAYTTAAGIHGMGTKCVAWLSKTAEVTIKRNGLIHQFTIMGSKHKCSDLKKIGKCPKSETGTSVTFSPNMDYFEGPIDPARVRERLEEYAYLCPGLTVKYTLGTKTKTICYPNGIKDAIKKTSKDTILKDPFAPTLKFSHVNKRSKKEMADIADIAVLFTNEESRKNIKSYTNMIYQEDGGAHQDAFERGLCEAVKSMAPKEYTFDPEFVLTGVHAIVSLKTEDPAFTGQAKNKLSMSAPLKEPMYEAMKAATKKYLKNLSEDDRKKIYDNAQAYFEASKEASNKAVSKKIKMQGGRVRRNQDPSILECLSLNPEECELFLVEGDSAKGVCMDRNTDTQAVLGVNGKTLNALNADISKVVNSVKISQLFELIGCGIGEDCDPSKSRYGKICLLQDADVDGAHIFCLLTGLFYMYMRPLLDAGMVFVANPPLFGSTKGNVFLHGPTYDNVAEQIRKRGEDPKKWDVKRFKGLGEMNSFQLGICCLNPETRSINKLTVKDSLKYSQRIVDVLGSEGASTRRALLFGETLSPV